MWSVFGEPDEVEEHEEEEEVEEIGLLSIPNELFSEKIFPHLCIADRLNARVNRRLRDAESKGRYYTKKLHIEMEIRFNWKTFKDRALKPQDGIEYKYCRHNADDLASLERVFANTSFGAVHVHFHEDRPIYRRLLQLIRDCDAPDVSMEIEDREALLGDGQSYDQLLLGLIEGRRSFVFKSHSQARLLEEGFERVYEAILSRALPLLASLEIHGYACQFVLESIGLRMWDPLHPETIWAQDPAEFEVFEEYDIPTQATKALHIFHAHVLIRLPSAFAPNPSSIYFRIFEDDAKVAQEKAELKARDDFIGKRVTRLV